MVEKQHPAEPLVVDRSKWPPGEWDKEPDRIDFKTKVGLVAFIQRSQLTGNWCGYVGVPKGHPAYGADGQDLSVHGGITYADKCSGHICHVPEPGEPDDVWWFGFDFCHAWDVAPGMLAYYQEVRDRGGPDLREMPPWKATYKNVAHAKKECERLAKQLVNK